MSLTPQIKRYIATQIEEATGTGSSAPSPWVTVDGNLYYSGGFVGIGLTSPAYPLDVSGSVNISTGSVYRIGGTSVLSATTLGSGVLTSSLTAVGTITTGVWQGSQIVDTYLATISTAGKVANSATTATASNTASAIVARDASGNFSAGIITASLSGNATTATTADKVANALTAGTYLTAGGTFDGSAARTFAVDATDANTASKVVARDASGNFSAGTISAAGLTASGLVSFASLKGTGATTVTNILDEDNMASNSDTALATQQSIKAYVDAQVTASDSLSEVLAIGNTTGANDIIVNSGQKIRTPLVAAQDGTSAITIANSTGALTLNTALTDSNLATISTAGKIANSATTAVSTNTPSTIVLRDGSGNFAAGVISATTLDATNLEVANIRTQDGDLAIAIADADALLFESGDKILLENDSGYLMATSVKFMVNGLDASQAVFTNASTELVSNPITGTGNVVMSASPTLTGTVQVANLTVSGTITGSLTGNVTGNASTATTLQTARNINGVSFNGSANITVAAAAGTLTGDTLASGVTASSLTSVGTLTALTVSGTATAGKFAPTANTVTGNGLYLPASDVVALSTAGAERLRMSATGFLKVANDGTYFSNTGESHEIRHNKSAGTVLSVDSSHTSISTFYEGSVLQITAARASGNNFEFIVARSSGVGGTAQFRVRGDGTIFAQNTTVQSISDERFKENIAEATDGLAVIMALRPVRYDWKAGYGNNRKHQLGFIAQEIEEIFPEAVSEWTQGDDVYKTVGPGALIPVLVKAIQDLHREVTSLREQLL